MNSILTKIRDRWEDLRFDYWFFRPITELKWLIYKRKNKVKDWRDFKSGDVIVWDPWWMQSPEEFARWSKSNTEEERIKWYGALGYGKEEKPLFVYISPINSCGDGVRIDSGHCTLMELGTGRFEWMRHPDDFRFATDEEF